ncbi:flagellar assembly protein FliH [Pantoea brenneri]|uniref:flagellar assembly protein FliH n=1 Tax=Pantoea brenneri TaxID=472694 RepID=UPI0028A29E0B|nr:flagellar assembly protein FliH [Pantoea brenneri]
MSTSDRPAAGSWQRWQPENLLESVAPVSAEAQPATPAADPATDLQFQAELARLRQQAEREGYAAGEQKGREQGQDLGYQQGFSEGQKAGRAQGAADVDQQQQLLVSRFSSLINEFQAALDSLDSVIPARLVQLSLNAVRSLFGKQIIFDTTLLLQKIEHLLQENLQFTSHIVLSVSEEDFPLVQQQLGEILASQHWALRADESIAPGGCRVTSDEGELDATLATQWQRLCNLSKEDYTS